MLTRCITNDTARYGEHNLEAVNAIRAKHAATLNALEYKL
jgi:hypothetical protein